VNRYFSVVQFYHTGAKNVTESKTSVLLQTRYWTVWYMDHLSASS